MPWPGITSLSAGLSMYYSVYTTVLTFSFVNDVNSAVYDVNSAVYDVKKRPAIL